MSNDMVALTRGLHPVASAHMLCAKGGAPDPQCQSSTTYDEKGLKLQLYTFFVFSCFQVRISKTLFIKVVDCLCHFSLDASYQTSHVTVIAGTSESAAVHTPATATQPSAINDESTNTPHTKGNSITGVCRLLLFSMIRGSKGLTGSIDFFIAFISFPCISYLALLGTAFLKLIINYNICWRFSSMFCFCELLKTSYLIASSHMVTQRSDSSCGSSIINLSSYRFCSQVQFLFQVQVLFQATHAKKILSRPGFDPSKTRTTSKIAHKDQQFCSQVQFLFQVQVLFQATHAKKGAVWNIGNCQSVDIWNDKWLSGMSLLEMRPSQCKFYKVRDLMVDDGSEWDVVRIHTLFPTEIVKRILSTHIASHRSDSLFWEGTAHGNFIVRDAYKKELANIGLIINQSDLDNKICSSLWKATIPMKVKLFIWRAWLNLLPTVYNLQRRHLILNNGFCVHCSDPH
ncbi:reverse transcriptase [Artemisia annua]|uniref:Reverse transcriptase n=1 Tax=Artemisia annua TaxID=35608 RepID=A0A2U1QIL3_ARTAN|nr:reverse transcriptase [Artemisia annua]